MDEVLDFFTRHWQLSAGFALLLAAYVGFELMQRSGSREVTPEQAIELYNRRSAYIWDVRSKEEFSVGHIVGAQLVNVDELAGDEKKLQKFKQTPIVVVCAHGKRSMRCVNILEAQGFTQVVSLAGGLHAWQESGLPLTKD